MSSPKTLILRGAIAVALLASAPAAMAQSDWTGAYLGVYLGNADGSDDNDTILFDNDLNGSFGDTVNTAAGANAFSPGFCDGIANTALPAGGCEKNTGGADYGFRGGYDWQMDDWVFGIVAEYGDNDVRDAVSAFSTTPARYTMLRKVDGLFALRARVGFAFGEAGNNLAYLTGGYARADVSNYFFTSNGVNTFTNTGDDNASGYQAGLGWERRFGSHFAMGLEYLHTRLDDDSFRVRAQGPAPATNPFIRVNAAGTDFRRSDDSLDFDTIKLTATWRFGGRERAMPVAEAVQAPVAQASCSALDDDGDGVNNCDDKCPGTSSGMAIGADGCPVPAAEPMPAPQPYRG
jgi:opacity protein-like surface antigen